MALNALKKKKRYDKQLQQIEGTLITIEQQRKEISKAISNLVSFGPYFDEDELEAELKELEMLDVGVADQVPKKKKVEEEDPDMAELVAWAS